MAIIETERLLMRQLTTEDAPFIFELLNEPSWIQFIGDKGIRTIEDARDYIVNGPMSMYARAGIGLYLTLLRENLVPIGLCGLIKRDSLEDVDIGYAFLPKFWGQGYAFESASGVLTYGRDVKGLNRIVAITSLDNDRSGNLLEKLGLQFEQIIPSTAGDEELKLYAIQLS
ncbi:GNAT family N-acetyltransferase [Paenibacillus sp. KN14-4R]|uniref:GNAT family N-acetyltransferase n=1 Tax=Paenibacillus sp. KN14-4R TaxID=3445773 RepID=UPI003F9EC2BC